MKTIRIKYLFFGLSLLLGLTACTGMDDTYKEFLDGRTVYVAKVEEAAVYAGENRALVCWNRISDPRAVSVEISWANGQQSVTKEITHPADTSLIISPLDEGSYSFSIRTKDDQGNSSLAVTASGEVYGEFYRSTLINRLVDKVTPGNGTLTVDFRRALNESFVRQEIRYFSSAVRDTVVRVVEKDEERVILEDYESELFRVVSYYNPHDLDFDIFASPEMIEYTPSKPYPILPLNGVRDASVCPRFEWKAVLGKESDTYQVLLSEDRTNWTTYSPEETETFIPRYALKPHTRYYWKAVTGSLESEVKEFTTGEKDIYGDEEFTVLSGRTAGNKASNFIFAGEGFTQAEYKVGGIFDKAVKEAYETLFKIDPYKSYKEYFNVYQLVAYAKEAGIENTAGTVFQTTANDERTSLTCNREKVNRYLEHIDGFTAADLDHTCVVVIVNANIDAGTTHYYTGGQTISLCPVYTNPDHIQFAEFRYLTVRQAGGFGYGLLGDEGIDRESEIPESGREELRTLWAQHRALNLDLVPQESGQPVEEVVRWKDFIGAPGYDKVRATYEGAFGYRKGVLRSEQSSAMNESRIPYFNTASRVAIVQRILRVAEEAYTLEKFKAKDYTGIATNL